VRISKDNLRGLFGVFLAFVIIALIYLLKPNISQAPDFACSQSSKEEVLIDVTEGESGSSIAQELEAAGVVRSSSSFFRIAVADPRASSIAPGIHRVQKSLCAKDALTQLLDRTRIENLLVIQEGAWNSEIKKSLTTLGFNNSEISKALSRAALPKGFTSLEGLLFPAQYSFDSSTSLNEIIDSLIMRASAEMKTAGFYEVGQKFTPRQLLIIASLAQAEGVGRDFAKISQVVRNRLALGMPLQFDSTVHYIMAKRGSIFLSTKSTYLKSPYNTYRQYGLPPTPINNPGAEAMYAASHPENGAWLYFITVAPGDTRFTDSFKEFGDWKILYKKNLRAGEFGSKK
jgi:UPF0755 protein